MRQTVGSNFTYELQLFIKTNEIMDFIAIDFETANSKRSSICSMGVAIVEKGKLVGTEHFYVKPTPNYYDGFNTFLHGISDKDTKNEKTFKQQWEALKKYFDKQTVIAHNASFDFSNEKVLGTPPVVFNAGVDFAIKYGFYGNVTYNYRDAMFYSYVPESNATDPYTKVHYETASYNLLNAKLGYQRNITNHLSLDATFGVNNITNTQYYQMVFSNQLPDAYLPAPYNATFFGGLNLKYTF